MPFIFSLCDYQGYVNGNPEKIDIVAVGIYFHSYMQLSELHELLKKSFSSMKMVDSRRLEIYGAKEREVADVISKIEAERYPIIVEEMAIEYEYPVKPLKVA